MKVSPPVTLPQRYVGLLLLALGLYTIGSAQTALAQDNVVIQWNNAALQEIRYFHPGAAINARALAITHTCMYDAWSAYDAKAVPTEPHVNFRRPPAERTEANKRKAISFAAYDCLSDLYPSEVAKFNVVMTSLGLDASDKSKDPATPSGIGHLAAQAVVNMRHHDGANQLGDLHPGAYTDYTGYVPANDPDHLLNPDLWQPLRTPVADHVMYGHFIVQTFETPQWGRVKPFAMTSGSQFRPKQGPASYTRTKQHYITQAEELIQLSAGLSDEQKMIAEYWADGPNSETPPGHWCLFAQFVSKRDHHKLDDDVKLFFTLSNALLDASITAWDTKLAYNSVRPVTAIHFLFSGKPIRAWGGRFKGTQTIDGSKWQPYQPFTNASTPPFPEFVSGHSTFSAAGAEILRRFTGSDVFGASYTYEKGRSKIEPGLTPRTRLVLSWPTFTDAANQAGMSRRYRGIHFADADLNGRKMGREAAAQAWDKAMRFINGEEAVARHSSTRN
jgi:hypothetical protein